MRKSMWGALALVLALAAWVSSQGDDDLVAPGKGGRSGGRQLAASSRQATTHDEVQAVDKPAPKDGAGARRSAGAEPSKPELGAADGWAARALISGTNAWQQRGTLKPLGQGVPLAWAGNAPPPPPPPPPYVAPPPPPPMAPPFPHRWVGRVNDEPVAGLSAASSASEAAGAQQPLQRAVLSSAQATWVVKAGDVIEGQWRIDQIQDRQMRLTYLPLKQSLSISMN
jgi:hypothetical protein